jgi:hypothetical protein
LARTIYLRCIYGIFCRDVIKYTVIYGVYILFWPTLVMYHNRQSTERAKYIGLARTIYIRCIYGIFCRDIIKHTVIYGVYIRFWPTLNNRHHTIVAPQGTHSCRS